MYYSDEARKHGPWIGAVEATTMVKDAQNYETVGQAQEYLIRRAGTHFVATCCAVMEIMTISETSRQRGSEESCLISPEFWEAFERPSRRTLSDWHAGDFELKWTPRWRIVSVVRVIGVQFSKIDLITELPVISEKVLGGVDNPIAARMRTGDPGKPPKGYQFYAAEHTRRCNAGEALTKVRLEAEYLAKWYRDNYPTADPASAGTIENRIRSTHRNFFASHSHDIIGKG